MRMANRCQRGSRLNGGRVAAEKEGGSLSVPSNLKQVKWQKEPHGRVGVQA